MQNRLKSSFYEGGKITRANNDFHNATGTFEELASVDRDTLRARARWLHENNPIMSNIDESIKNYVIGGGIKFQLKLENDALNSEIETKWEYAKSSLDVTNREHFDDMCSSILKTRFMDGEVPIYLPIIKDGSETRLGVQLIEADRFALGKFNIKNGVFFDGIETDVIGKPIAYHFQNNLFNTVAIKRGAVNSDIRLAASDMLYYYKRDNRTSQYRGISEYKQAITDLKNFQAYIRATIESARSRANISYVISKENKPQINSFSRDKDLNPIEEINGIFVQYLNKGEKLEKLDPDQVGDNFSNFVGNIVRLIAVARKVSYELALRDYTNTNYSSGRMSLLQDKKLFENEFAHFSRNVYKPILMKWLELEVMKGNIKHISYSQFLAFKSDIYNSITLYAPKQEWVDPQKEANALAIELANKTKTYQEVYSSRGIDWEEAFEQSAKETARMKELGIAPMFMNTDTTKEDDEDDKTNNK